MFSKTKLAQSKTSETLFPFTRPNLKLPQVSNLTKCNNTTIYEISGAKNNRLPLLVKHFLQRSIIAFASLRITPTATTSTTSSVASTSSTSASFSLGALLKLFLLSCYYIISFSSLLLIIICINHFAGTFKQITDSSSKFKLPSNVPVLDQVDFLPSTTFLTVQTVSQSTTQASANRTRLKRSIGEDEEVLPGNRFSSTSKSPRGSQLSMATNTIKATRGSQKVDPHPEIKPKRQSTSYSLNNRGTLVNSSVHNNRASNVWIPIVVPSKPIRQTVAPQVRPSSSTVLSTTTTRKTTSRILIPPIEVTAAESIQVQPHHLSTYHTPIEYHHHHHHHPFIRQNLIGQWRRPRFNEPQITSKMYKRVLLCDKTIVSLDYVRNFEPKPFNKHHQHEPDFFDDNFIDLDDRVDASEHHTQAYYNPSAISIDKNYLSSSFPAKENNNTRQLLNTASSEVIVSDNLKLERRSYLTDEDPLVKCDMWDLEKGLKNRKPPKEILQMAVRADFDTVRDAINRCRQLTEKTLPPDDEYRDGIEIMSTEDLVSLFSMKRGLLPGTKWCGLGDQASTYNDLGPKHRIDICCRAHDHCPIRLKPFRNDYGVLNIALYTKSHCDCDADFYRCLREVHSRTADMLGNLYFNVMKLQCLREERMKVCREMKHFALGFERCIRYEESPVKTVFKFTTPPVAY